MRTKFDSIVKIKKNELEKIENDLVKVNSAIKLINEKIDNLNKELSSFSFPKEGDFKKIYQIKTFQNALREEIENYKNQLKMLEERKNLLTQKYKEAHIEYEKMKFLQAEEIKKLLKKQKQKEQIQMDEIAILLRPKNE